MIHTITIPGGEHCVLSIPAGAQELVYYIGADAQCVIIDQEGDQKNMQTQSRSITFYCAHNADLTYYTSMLHSRQHVKTIRVILQGQHARARIRALYILNDAQQVQVQVRQEHRAPDTYSDVVCKGVLSGAAQAVYEGTIYIDYAAHRSDANQQNKNLLFGNQAYARSIPALEVLTNEVRCKHGSAAGQVDPMQLFYMQARGIEVHAARSLLVAGFIDDIVKDAPGMYGDICRAIVNQKL